MSHRSIALLLVMLGIGCKPGPEQSDAGVDAGARAKPHLHAHNDFEQSRPLLDALEQGFDSIEADIDLMTGDLFVTHDGVNTKGTLKALYLEPLKARVAANGGSVHGDGKTLYLWIDLRDQSQTFMDLLAQQLSGYDFLTTFDDSGVQQERAVTVILTGNANAKAAMVERPAPRPYTRDGGKYDAADPVADGKWRAYAIDYRCCVFWFGDGEIRASDLRNLREIVDGAHARSRQVRFWAAPQTHEYYRVAADVGVDFVATDDLADLSSYMKTLFP